MKRNYDSTVARIAGNIASGTAQTAWESGRYPDVIAEWCVAIARAIVAEVERTEPSATPPSEDR